MAEKSPNEPQSTPFRNPHIAYRPVGIVSDKKSTKKDDGTDADADKGSKWKMVQAISELGDDLAAGKLVKQRIANAGATISSVKDFAKDSSKLLKFGIETFDSLANPLLMPLMMTVDKKIVSRVDPALSYCYDRALKVGEKVYNIVGVDQSGLAKSVEEKATNIYGLVVRSEWLEKVDSIIDPPKMYAAEAIGRFNAAILKAFDDAAKIAKKTQKSIGEVSPSDFVARLKAEMAGAWDEKLKEPAQALFNKLKEEYMKVESGKRLEEAKKIIPSLQKMWEEKVVSVFKERTRPATLAFNGMLEVYAKYREMAESKGAKVTYDAFMTEVKAKLKDAYDEKLAPHIKEVYDAANQYKWARVSTETNDETPRLEGGSD
eukprot:CAMPEP_0114491202 /NCGR_PEP_ID=MMETSP0109-20121206/2868_1 /TAXON_ID=29199 /ORGANISM="Chlorarachnion reptans, Strain CCCM449" /LENGTH=374 /DNA_ID=CAMNT_0001667907 /DNA_START=44 /DNA_END=1168 /DNA_ORIENTATION=-